MKDAAKQSQCDRAGIHFSSDAVDGNGGNSPKCLTDCNRKGQHRQLHDLGWIRHCESSRTLSNFSESLQLIRMDDRV